MMFGRRYPTLRPVIVHTATDRSFRGLLWARKGGYLVLRDAALIHNGASQQLPGELAIPDDNVDFVQVIGGPE